MWHEMANTIWWNGSGTEDSNLCQIKTTLCQNYSNVSLHAIWFSADNLFVNSSFQRRIFRLFSSEICIIV